MFGEISQGFVFYLEASDIEQGRQVPIKRMQLTYEDKEITLKELVGGARVDLRFGQDNQNELYLMEKGRGRIFKIVKVTKE